MKFILEEQGTQTTVQINSTLSLVGTISTDSVHAVSCAALCCVTFDNQKIIFSVFSIKCKGPILSRFSTYWRSW